LKELQQHAKLQDAALETLRDESVNRSAVLQIMQKSIDDNAHVMERHDKRAETMNSDIREIRTILNTRPCVNEKKDNIIT
jgi:hypothetical protein